MAKAVPGSSPTAADGPASGEKRQIEYTISRDDLFEEVGITDKMLRDWTESGLFQAKLGKRTRRFTKDDVTKLKYIRHLRQELGLSTETTLKLLSRFRGFPADGPEMQVLLPPDPNARYPFIDVKTVQLVDSNEAVRTVIQRNFDAFNLHANSPAPLSQLESWTVQMAINLFSHLHERHRQDPDHYAVARERVFQGIREAERAVRMVTGERLEWINPDIPEPIPVTRCWFSPPAEGDPDPIDLDEPDAEKLRKLRKLIAAPELDPDLDEIPF